MFASLGCSKDTSEDKGDTEEASKLNVSETENSPKPSEYELKRATNIKNNLSMVSSLGLVSHMMCTVHGAWMDVCATLPSQIADKIVFA